MTQILKKTWVNTLFIILGALLPSCSEPSKKEDNSIIIQSTSETDTTTIEVTEKTDVETAIGDAKAIIEAGQELIDAKRKRDSVRLASREKMFAYQLGLPFKNKQLVIEAYMKLSDTEGIRVLKKSKHDYLLIKFDNKEEEQLKTELDDYINEHGDEIIGTVKIIDLVRECGKHQKPVQDLSIKEKKSEISIDCLTCHDE